MPELPPLSALRTAHPDAFEVTDTLARAGHRALWAGGCVRDLLLGRTFSDIDIASDATPDQVEALFPHTHAIGKAFGVIQVVSGDQTFEVAAFRRDLDQTDGRHPGRIEPGSPEEDALRRDFTVNGLFLDPQTGDLLDVVGGRKDLEQRVIRAIGDPDLRFREDHLRLLRAVRFASVLDFELEPATREAIRRHPERLRTVSPERVRTECIRTLTESSRAGDALTLLRDTGLLREVLPEMLDTVGCEQPPEFHPEGDVWTPTVMMLNELESPSPALALATLLHDIGKPATRTVDADGRIRFMGHARVGAEIADRWLRNLRASNALRRSVVGMVDRHMDFMNVPHMRTATLQKVVARPDFEDELELHRIDCLCSNGITASTERLKAARADFERRQALPEPLVTGNDFLEMGMSPGPEVGKWKDAAYEIQLEHPEVDREGLMQWVRSRLS